MSGLAPVLRLGANADIPIFEKCYLCLLIRLRTLTNYFFMLFQLFVVTVICRFLVRFSLHSLSPCCSPFHFPSFLFLFLVGLSLHLLVFHLFLLPDIPLAKCTDFIRCFKYLHSSPSAISRLAKTFHIRDILTMFLLPFSLLHLSAVLPFPIFSFQSHTSSMALLGCLFPPFY